jgi:hypothetical protein
MLCFCRNFRLLVLRLLVLFICIWQVVLLPVSVFADEVLSELPDPTTTIEAVPAPAPTPETPVLVEVVQVEDVLVATSTSLFEASATSTINILESPIEIVAASTSSSIDTSTSTIASTTDDYLASTTPPVAEAPSEFPSLMETIGASTSPEYIDVEKDAYSLRLPTNPSSPMLLNNLEVRLIGASTSTIFTQLDTGVTYHDVFASTDIKYEVNEDNLKESIILKDTAHPSSFSYELNLEAYDYRQVSDNEIELYKKGKGGNALFKQFTLTAPYMLDAKGATSTNIIFVLDGNTLSVVPDAEWLSTASYPVMVDPTIEITVLNVHSYPVQGEYWNVDFTTVGAADLTITPADQATIDDMQFNSLKCGDEDRTAGAQVSAGDVISYTNWSCDDVATVSHLDLKTGNHHLIFEFNNATESATSSEAFNATIVWDGGGVNALWSNGDNWVGNVAPGTNDVAAFDNTCVSNCSPTISASASVGGVSIASTYAGTIAQDADTVLTVGGSGFSIAGGTYNGSSSTTLSSLVLNGSFSQTGGVFSAPAGIMDVHFNLSLTSGTFTHNSGIVRFTDINANEDSTLTCSGTPFNKVIIYKDQEGDMIISSGCTVPLGASPTSAFTSTNSVNNGTITIASGTWTEDGWANIPNNGTINHNGNGWVSAGGLVNGSSGVVTYSGTTASFRASLNVANGTFPSGLDVTFTDINSGNDTTLTCGSVTFSKVTIYKDQEGDMVIASGCTVPLGNSPTTAFSSSNSVNNGTITIASGTWTDDGYANITNNGTITHNGNGWYSKSGLIMGNTGVVTYSGTTATFESNLDVSHGSFPNGISVTFNDTHGGYNTTLTCGSVAFGGIIFNKDSGGFAGLGGSCTDTGNFSLTGGTLSNPASAYTFTVQGNLSQTSSGTFGGANLQVNLTGTASSSITKTAGTFASPLVINKTSTSTNLNSSFTSAGSGTTCTVSGGTLDLKGNNFTCGSTFSIASGATLALGGNESSVTSPTLASGSTVAYKGDRNGSASTVSNFKNWSYSNLTIDTGDSGDIIDGSGLASVSVAGNLNLALGNLKTPTTFSVMGNIAGNGGAITEGTVTLNGTNQQITGSPTFYNLTKNITGAADTLTFEAGGLTTINGTMNLQGESGHLLSLRSSTPGTRWRLYPVGARTIAYLDVKDSYNIGTTIDSIGNNITDSGNNAGWGFDWWTQSQYQFFNNADSLIPGSQLGLLSTSTTIVSGSSPLRLRLNLQANADIAASSTAFKLQVATSTTGSWYDIGTPIVVGWWDSSWQNRRKITFDNSSSATDLTDFPVLVSLNATTGNIDYSKTKAGGADIRFVDSGGNALNYEIEKWDTTATSTVWVKVPTLHAGSDTDYIWMYYNNTSASDAQNATGVWDSNYKGVYHLPNGSTLTTNDSTSNSANGINSGATATSGGQIDGAATFGSTKYIDLSSLPTYAAADFTITTWVKFSSLTAYNIIIVGKLQAANVMFISTQSNGQGLRMGRTGVVEEASANYTWSTDTWYQVALTRTSGAYKFYVNGIGLNTAGSSNFSYPSTNTTIGGDGASFPLNGSLDEFRLSASSRPSDYIVAEYATEVGTMNSYAAEESASTYTIWDYYDNASVTSSTTLSSLLLTNSGVAGTYQEGEPTPQNSSAVSANQYIEYDFVLNSQNEPAGTTYYLRLVRNDGTVLYDYSEYPTIVYQPENAPDAASALGPATAVSGGTVTTATPSLTFNLSDADVGDTVKYEIQISTSPSFSSNVIDYLSPLQAQGAATFTVGQAASGGTYITGSAATTLPDSSTGYYWRVWVIDNSGALSPVATANSGAVAFKVDSTPAPTVPSSSGNSSGSSSGRSDTPSSGGGGGGSNLYSILINAGAATTTMADTVLNMTAPIDTAKVRVSNQPDFATTTPFDFAQTSAWDLCEKPVCQPGIYSVFAKFYDYKGLPSAIYADSIYLSQKAKEKLPKTEPPLTVMLVGSLDGTIFVGSLSNVPAQTPIYLQAVVSGQGKAKGKSKLTYLFDCDNDGRADFQVSNTPKSTIKTGPLCRFADSGYHFPSVQVLSGEPTVTDKMLINISGTPIITPVPETPPVVAPIEVPVIPPVVIPTSTPITVEVSEPPPALNIIELISEAATHAGQALQTVVTQAARLPEAAVREVTEKAPEVAQFIVAASETKQAVLGVGVFSFTPILLAVQNPMGALHIAFAFNSFSDMYYSLIGLIQALFSTFGLRKRRRYWGTVYDAITKQPIDPAIVELVDATTGQVIEQSITDLYGRFGFLDSPGYYFIRVAKTHYLFPSKIVQGEIDGVFENVYHGEKFVIHTDQGVTAPNIPMDPQALDWNQQEKMRKGIGINFKLHTFILSILKFIFWIGYAVAFTFLLFKPTTLNGVIVLLYSIFALLNRNLPGPRLWGEVVSESGQPTNSLSIELAYKAIPNIVVGKAYTNADGKFFLKAIRGDYILTIKDLSKEESPVVHTQQIQIEKMGTLNSQISIL